MAYSAWTKIDNGREGLWDLDVWLGVIELVGQHEDEDVYNENSPIYAELESRFPGKGWKKFDANASHDNQFRPLFRDYSKPWTNTKTVSLDNQRFSLAHLGKQLLLKTIGPSDVFRQLLLTWNENGEKPFQILANAALDYNKPLNLHDYYFGIMLGYRPGDDIGVAISQGRTGRRTPLANEERRLKLMLRIMELAGCLVLVGDKWHIWNRSLLEEVAANGLQGVRESKVREIVGLLPSMVKSIADAGVMIPRSLIWRAVASMLSKRFLILTGMSGSGKTQLAQAFARWITESQLVSRTFPIDSEVPGTEAKYKVTASTDEYLELTNEEGNRVGLPLALVREWASYIRANDISREKPSLEIRDGVKDTSSYSNQLHSFHAPLKAAAFALLDSTGHDAPLSPSYVLIPVGADWTGNENVLGYPDGLRPPKLRPDGSLDVPGSYVTKPALDLMLQAKAFPDIPHFLILDEMNLSHVERYFADILSAIESTEEIPLHHDTVREANGKPIPPRVALPTNLFIIGTVNVDETTYMFSPKVLDRANVIEFRMLENELKSFLGNPAKPDLWKLDGKGANYGEAFVTASREVANVPADVRDDYEEEMVLFFTALRAHGAEFGYRVAHESARFAHFYKLLGNPEIDGPLWFPSAFDCIVVQKMLPKLHGSKAKLGPLLKKLWFLCVNKPADRGPDALKAAEDASRSTEKKDEPSIDVPAGAPYPLSAEKIGRMWRLLNENGFTSFAEA